MQRHGWTLLTTDMLLVQLEKMKVAAERARRADPSGWSGNSNVRLLAMLLELVLDRIPSDPFAPAYRQGNTLGPAYRHWFRAKFAGNRFRLFFRADSATQIIVYAWVNHRDTLRKPGAASDPYAVFGRMLASGNPPDGWPELLATARNPTDALRIGDGTP